MLSYIGRRLIFVGPQLVGILLVSFLLLKLIPGDPAVMMLGPFATDDGLARLRSELGLDRSVFEQFGFYLWRVLHGDLGSSWQTTTSPEPHTMASSSTPSAPWATASWKASRVFSGASALAPRWASRSMPRNLQQPGPQGERPEAPRR